jgi:hypothetical protein
LNVVAELVVALSDKEEAEPGPIMEGAVMTVEGMFVAAVVAPETVEVLRPTEEEVKPVGRAAVVLAALVVVGATYEEAEEVDVEVVTGAEVVVVVVGAA